ncbi:formate/nitrite transporter family protein [Sphingomonas sp. DT-51]|uniref:formate/nitrite transporter family protein n=1 Tax=Sphingomonas sp. DT-51 TaxID=3396165 RepID=UPI003F1DDF25
MYEPTISHFAEVAREKAEGLGRSPFGFLVGAMFAGAYIGIAMILALSVAAGLPAGARPLAMGAVFGVGLILTIFAGAELFTGYAMYLGFGLARGSVSIRSALSLLIVVWVGNAAGALILSLLFKAGGGGAIFAGSAEQLHVYVAHKVDSDALALLARGVLCNWLVCLAIWTAVRVHGDAAKCIVLGWILMAFVASGFEHSVANMTALTLGVLVSDPSIGLAGAARNLTIVTVANVLGGLVFVVGGYLAAARADPSGEARHDTGPLPSTMRTQASTPPKAADASAC